MENNFFFRKRLFLSDKALLMKYNLKLLSYSISASSSSFIAARQFAVRAQNYEFSIIYLLSSHNAIFLQENKFKTKVLEKKQARKTIIFYFLSLNETFRAEKSSISKSASKNRWVTESALAPPRHWPDRNFKISKIEQQKKTAEMNGIFWITPAALQRSESFLLIMPAAMPEENVRVLSKWETCVLFSVSLI